MRKVSAVLLLLLLLLPLVSAGGVSYYPDKASFEEFLESNTTYQVVPGEDAWARGWARYVDAKLGEVLEHGNGTTVLVGNVYENPEMRLLWNLTGLPESFSLSPMVVVVNDTVFITGAEDNIYLTHEAFSEIWAPTKEALTVFAVLALAIIILVVLSLRKGRDYSPRFFILAASLVFSWFVVSEECPLSGDSVKFLFEALTVSSGGASSSPLATLVGGILSVIPPVDENLWLVHWLLLLSMAGLFFYVAPRHERGLGFVALGLALSSPVFRSEIGAAGSVLPGLVLMLLVLALAMNLPVTPGMGRTVQVLVLAFATLVASLVNPYVLLFPLFLALTYPGRRFMNSLYLVLTWAGFGALVRVYGSGWLADWASFQFNVGFFEGIVSQSFLSLVVLLYALATSFGKIRWKGPTAFITLSTLAFLLMAPFVEGLFPYVLVLISVLAVRLVHSVIQT